MSNGLASFKSYVEDWRPLVSSMANGLSTSAGDQTDFLLAWISIESSGDPCSWGCAGTCTGNCNPAGCSPVGRGEVGIFQLEEPDNINAAGSSYAALHPQPPCVAGQSYATFSSLTPEQQTAQVQAGINYVNYCANIVRTVLAGAGTSWDETQSDFWRLVKLVHVAPSCLKNGVSNFTATNGAPPQVWDDVASMSGCPAGWMSNANSVGAYGGGSPDPDITDVIAVNTGGPLLMNYLTLGIALFAGAVLGVGIESFVAHRRRKRAR